MDQIADFEHTDSTFMGDIFEAVGFEIADEESYNLIAEYVEAAGEHSLIYRGDVAIHGRCWKIGEGLEVWSVLYETPTELHYADCRPSYRSRYVHTIQPWELAEYDEDGEAVIRGQVAGGAEIVFELQNLTEVRTQAFRSPRLQVAIAGLASSIRTHPRRPIGEHNNGTDMSRHPIHEFRPALTHPVSADQSYETDYIISGSVLACRDMRNQVTGADLVWIYIDATTIRLEVLASRRALRRKLKVGEIVTANVWLQGHILEETEISARYEGVDQDCLKSDFWSLLKRCN